MKDKTVIVYTGFGKGKTSASIGTAIRAADFGHRVFYLAFDKGGEDKVYSERKTLQAHSNIKFIATGEKRYEDGKDFRFGWNNEDIQEAERGIKLSKEALTNSNFDVVILDEIFLPVKGGVLEESEILDILSLWQKQNKTLVMTGRYAPKTIIEKIKEFGGTVSEIKEISHHYKSHKEPIKGIDV